MSELNFAWVLGGQCQITKAVQEILIPREEVAYCCKSIRDVAVFTNKRFIYSDSQGITGKKKEIYSIPYSVINMYSSENAGTLDFTAEIELWTRAGHIKISLKRDADVRMIDRMIAVHILR